MISVLNVGDTTNSALFDAVVGITSKNQKSPSPSVSLDHYIFDGTYGWMVRKSKKQPSVNLRISVNKSDYDQLNLPAPAVKSSKIDPITDTGAQSSLMGFKVFRKCRFNESMLLPVKRKMYAANNEGIDILGAFFIRLTGRDNHGNTFEAAEMVCFKFNRLILH